MATYKLTINKIWIPAGGGQGIFEGTEEIRVTARMNSNGQELSKTVPGANQHYPIKAGGAVQFVGLPIGEVTNPPTGGQTVHIEVVEIDGGTLGNDDYGSADLIFQMSPGMPPLAKVATMSLHRPKMPNPLGSVSVEILAEQI